MPLTDELAHLRNHCLSSLDASHDYYVHTKRAWRLVQQIVRQGHQFTIQNQVTGHKVNESELSRLAQNYITGYLISATFQHFVSLFEQFMFDFLRLWLTEHPRSLSGRQLQFRSVLDATDKNEIVAGVVQKEVVGLTYRRVVDWFAYLEKIAQLGRPTEEQIARVAEIKASRDVLVHNDGVANATYVRKPMGKARFSEGEPLTISEPFHRESWELIKNIVADIADAGIGKAQPR